MYLLLSFVYLLLSKVLYPYCPMLFYMYICVCTVPPIVQYLCYYLNMDMYM